MAQRRENVFPRLDERGAFSIRDPVGNLGIRQNSADFAQLLFWRVADLLVQVVDFRKGRINDRLAGDAEKGLAWKMRI